MLHRLFTFPLCLAVCTGVGLLSLCSNERHFISRQGEPFTLQRTPEHVDGWADPSLTHRTATGRVGAAPVHSRSTVGAEGADDSEDSEGADMLALSSAVAVGYRCAWRWNGGGRSSDQQRSAVS